MIEIAIDQDHYPTENFLKSLERYAWESDDIVVAAEEILLEILPEAAKRMEICQCRIKDSVHEYTGRKVKQIEFVTGGWSGAEDLIEAILSTPARMLYYKEWRRGGYHLFEVPE